METGSGYSPYFFCKKFPQLPNYKLFISYFLVFLFNELTKYKSLSEQVCRPFPAKY